MKFVLILCLIATVSGGPFRGYHEEVGIPLAARIHEAELAAIQSGSSARIIGGRPSPLGAHPYLVGLVIHLTSGFLSGCGASMVSNTRALTAAHCCDDGWSQVEDFTLAFGSEHLFFGGVRVNTRDFVLHPGWDTQFIRVEDDIAIVRFPFVSYTDFIQPISLPTGDLVSNDFTGEWVQAAGYGKIADSIGIQPDQVQSHVTLQVISNEDCYQVFGGFVTEKIICTSGVGPVGICSTDSGGPLSIEVNGQRLLIGVVSFSSSAGCESQNPSGYVRITAQLPWIHANL